MDPRRLQCLGFDKKYLRLITVLVTKAYQLRYHLFIHADRRVRDVVMAEDRQNSITSAVKISSPILTEASLS